VLAHLLQLIGGYSKIDASIIHRCAKPGRDPIVSRPQLIDRRPRWINPGRDTIGSLPGFAHLATARVGVIEGRRHTGGGQHTPLPRQMIWGIIVQKFIGSIAAVQVSSIHANELLDAVNVVPTGYLLSAVFTGSSDFVWLPV
jgi:hypothetical protein